MVEDSSGFFRRGVTVVLLGFLKKYGCRTRVFCGEVVVECVVNVVRRVDVFRS